MGQQRKWPLLFDHLVGELLDMWFLMPVPAHARLDRHFGRTASV
jgi:hypothetical protein